MQFLKGNQIDIRTQYLLYGYIRKMQMKIAQKIIPTSLINLCISFYYANQRILFIEKMNNQVLIKIAELKGRNSQLYQCQSDHRNPVINKICNSSFYLCNDMKLPPIILNSKFCNRLDIKRLYDILFVISEKGSIGAYIIDSCSMYNLNKYIQYYFAHLPQLGANKFTVNASLSLCYSANHGLIAIGANNKKNSKNNSIFSKLHLDIGKWGKIDKMDRWRKMGISTMIDENKLIYCGGFYNRTYVKWASLYDFNENKWIKMSNMNDKRCRSGIYCERYVYKRVYIGGGKTSRGAVNTFEYLDIAKDKWIVIKNSKYSHVNPIIWMENPNIINIASVYANIFECMDLRMGKWKLISIKHGKHRSVNSIFDIPILNTNVMYAHKTSRLCV
eukprot:462061_1